jgi:hypothetical protein
LTGKIDNLFITRHAADKGEAVIIEIIFGHTKLGQIGGFNVIRRTIPCRINIAVDDICAADTANANAVNIDVVSTLGGYVFPIIGNG